MFPKVLSPSTIPRYPSLEFRSSGAPVRAPLQYTFRISFNAAVKPKECYLHRPFVDIHLQSSGIPELQYVLHFSMCPPRNAPLYDRDLSLTITRRYPISEVNHRRTTTGYSYLHHQFQLYSLLPTLEDASTKDSTNTPIRSNMKQLWLQVVATWTPHTRYYCRHYTRYSGLVPDLRVVWRLGTPGGMMSRNSSRGTHQLQVNQAPKTPRGKKKKKEKKERLTVSSFFGTSHYQPDSMALRNSATNKVGGRPNLPIAK